MERNTFVELILVHFTSLDILKLRLYLKDEYTY